MDGPQPEIPSYDPTTTVTRRRMMQAVAGALLAGGLVRNGGRAATVAAGTRYWDFGAAVPILADAYEEMLLANGDVFFGPSGGGNSGIPPEVDALFAEDSPALQVRFDRVVAPDNSRAAYLYQIQFSDTDGATAGYESLLATIRRSDAEDVTKTIKGLGDAAAYRLGFSGNGQEISRISAAGRYDDTVIFLLDDRYGGRKNEVGPGRSTFTALAEGYELARSGERPPAHAALVPGIPLLEGVRRLGYSPAYVGGMAVPRLGADMAGVARSNPGVQDSISGNFALTVGSDQYAVFFAIRRFVDETAQKHYFENVGDIYEESGQALGIQWVRDETVGESARTLRAFPALQDEPTATEIVFGGWIAAAKLLGVDVVVLMDQGFVIDVGLFLLLTGVVDALPEGPDGWPDHERRRDAARNMIRGVAARLETSANSPELYLPDGTPLSDLFAEDDDDDD